MSEEMKININRGEDYTKFTVTSPLITKDEEIILDSYLHDIVKDMNNCYVHDKELALMQEVTRRLQQENQQLKEQLKDEENWRVKIAKENSSNVSECLKLIEQKKQYKSVLDEIREYIKECTSSPDEYENFISKGEVKHLLQILDKVKENDNKE